MRWMTPSVLLSSLFWAACPSPVAGDMPPRDRFYFPIAMTQRDNQIYVVSSNSDGRYIGGSVISLNLETIDQKLASLRNQDIDKLVIPTIDVLTSSIVVPSSGRSPLFFDQKLVLLSREKEALISIDENTKSWISAQLPWPNPDHIIELSKSGSRIKGLIGYLSSSKREQIDPNQASLVRDFGELQTFEWDTSTSKLDLGPAILLHDLLPEDTVPVDEDEKSNKTKKEDTSPTPKDTSVRRLSNIGSMRKLDDDYVLLGIDALASYGDLFSNQANAKLIWFKMNQDGIDKKTVTEFNLSSIMNGQTIKDFDVAPLENEAGHRVYVLLDRPSTLVRVDMVLQNGAFSPRYHRQRALCQGPGALRVSRDGKTVLVTCFDSNEFVAYDFDTLDIVGKAATTSEGLPFGRGPAAIWLDLRNSQAYVSYFLDGTVGVFDVKGPESGANRIQVLGRIGEQAPLSQAGGI